MANRIVKLDELKHYNEESYAYPMSVTKAVEVDKTKSISDMTSDELRMLINRLRDEREAEDTIRSLRRSAGQKDTFENPAKIDTKTPIEQMYHSGILGMKWGRRRFQNKDGTRTAAGKKRDEAEDYTNSRNSKSKGLARLSNDELRRLNERLQLESTYKTLSSAKVKKAESFVGKVLKNSASAALSEFSKNLMIGSAKLLVKTISPSFAELSFNGK